MIGVYKIQSQIDPKRIYVGSAINIGQRWKLHLRSLNKNKHHSIKLQRHFNKYGESDLQFSILLSCEKEDLLKIEQYFIDSLNPYFNICRIAGNSSGIEPWNKGKHWSPEMRQKLSLIQKGKKKKPFTKEHKENIGKAKKGLTTWSKGKHQKPEAIEKSRIARTGKKRTDEMKKRISDACKKGWAKKRAS